MSGDSEPGPAGRRRALLVGSSTYGLTGCRADVALMGEVLGRRGFDEIDVRVDSDATREGILDGFESLIGGVGTGDVVVVYYSGHGGRIVRPDFESRKAAGLSVDFQFVVPFDMGDSDIGDFRGLTSEELTQLQRRLTDAFHAAGTAANVTTILDCCHAGFMARDADDAHKKSVDVEAEVFGGSKAFRMKGIREHLEQLGSAVALAGVVTNPEVLRVVACQPEQSAYELKSPRGGRHGALTDALAAVLDELGDAAVPWGVIGDIVRRRVRSRQPAQRTDVEGPQERLAFSTATAGASRSLPVAIVGGAAVIEAAVLLGVAVGDEFDVIDLASGGALGRVAVTGLDGDAAVLGVDGAAAAALEGGAGVAVPVRISVPKLSVDVTAVPELGEELSASSRLAVGVDSAVARVEPGQAAGSLALLDPSGGRWRTADFGGDAAGRRAVVAALEAIAVGHRLLDLAAADHGVALDDVIEVELTKIDVNPAGAPVATVLPAKGARLAAGDRVNVTVRNLSRDALFVWVFDVGTSGRAGILSRDARSGYPLGAAGSEGDRFQLWGSTGEALFWPPDVPTDGTPPERWETFVVIVADRRADLSSLSPPTETTRSLPGSALEALLAEARTGTREAPPAGAGESLRYRIDTVEFLLAPRSIGN